MNDTQILGSYGYDPAGWRIWKEEDGKTFIYVRDASQTIYQEIFNGIVDSYSTPETKRAFVYLGNELVGTVINDNEARYYINDHLGTTELVTDVNGNILSQIQHTPFGDEIVVQSGTSTSSNSEDYYFTGKELDATGLYYFGARYYDPEVGLFISEDPGKDGTNWYRYCKGNPVNFFDPNGMYAIYRQGMGRRLLRNIKTDQVSMRTEYQIRMELLDPNYVTIRYVLDLVATKKIKMALFASELAMQLLLKGDVEEAFAIIAAELNEDISRFLTFKDYTESLRDSIIKYRFEQLYGKGSAERLYTKNELMKRMSKIFNNRMMADFEDEINHSDFFSLAERQLANRLRVNYPDWYNWERWEW